MPSTNRKRVREVYFYKTESGEYKIDLVDGRDNIVKEQLYYPNRSAVNEFIEELQNNKNTRFECSALGTKIYNKKPEQRMLTKSSQSIFETYVNNLSSLKENAEYQHKISSLLRSVADLVDPVSVDGCGCDEPESTSLEPSNPISPEIGYEMSVKVQDNLGIEFEDDFTFWFQDQKWQLTKDVYDYDTPEMQKPKTSHNIRGTMDYMATLLGVNAEMNTNIGENSFRFEFQGEIYKIKHVYTGDHNTIPREY